MNDEAAVLAPYVGDRIEILDHPHDFASPIRQHEVGHIVGQIDLPGRCVDRPALGPVRYRIGAPLALQCMAQSSKRASWSRREPSGVVAPLRLLTSATPVR